MGYNGQTVNVVTADVGASNGVIHVIDNVIVGAPQPAAEPAVEPAPEPAPVEEVAEVGDVVDVAVGNGAFTKLPEGTLESLTPEQAKAIVSRHVVAGATV